MSRSMFSYACALGSMFSTYFMIYSICLCAPCHVYVPRPRLCLSCHVLLLALLSLCLSLLCFGLMVGTQSRPYGLCHRPYTLAHIKGFGSPLFACLCLLASMLYACVSLSSSRFCHA